MRASDDDLITSLLASGDPDAPGSEWSQYRLSHAPLRGEYSVSTSDKAFEIGKTLFMDSMHGVLPPSSPVSFWPPYTAHLETVSLPLRREIVALRNKIAALEEEQGRLREQLQRLEHRHDEIGPPLGETDAALIDPHTRWIEENLERLSSHPNEWIALHAVRGILFHTADGDEFSNMLDRLSPEERDDVLAFHSSMYV
jgi:hypothetical protein